MFNPNESQSVEEILVDLADNLNKQKEERKGTRPNGRDKIQSTEEIPELEGHEGDVFYRALAHWIYLITNGDPKTRKQMFKHCRKHMEELGDGRNCDPVEKAIIEKIELTRLQLYHYQNTFANMKWVDIQNMKMHQEQIESLDSRYVKALEQLHKIREKNRSVGESKPSPSETPKSKRMKHAG